MAAREAAALNPNSGVSFKVRASAGCADTSSLPVIGGMLVMSTCSVQKDIAITSPVFAQRLITGSVPYIFPTCTSWPKSKGLIKLVSHQKVMLRCPRQGRASGGLLWNP